MKSFKIFNNSEKNRIINDQRSEIPQIAIFSSVLRFIEDEVKAVPDHLETGGLLLGSLLGNGRLITHATPPGPRAIHQGSMFEKDLEFSQAILNHLVQITGVDYIGEWHKHPPYLKRPSSGDRQGAIEILQDSDYKTNGLLVFPIWIKEKKVRSTTLHQFLFEHYFGSIDIVKCFPYYMDETLEFYPFNFRIAKCDLGTQSEVKRFYNHYIELKKGQPLNDQGKDIEEERSQSCGSEEEVSIKNELLSDVKEQEDQSQSEGSTKESSQWYETQFGMERQIKETNLLNSSKHYRGLKIHGDGRLLFRMSSPVISDLYLDVICGQDHPISCPDLFLHYKEQYKQIKVDDFSEEHLIKESFFHKKMTELTKVWEEQEATLLIYHYIKSLGFY